MYCTTARYEVDQEPGPTSAQTKKMVETVDARWKPVEVVSSESPMTEGSSIYSDVSWFHGFSLWTHRILLVPEIFFELTILWILHIKWRNNVRIVNFKSRIKSTKNWFFDQMLWCHWINFVELGKFTIHRNLKTHTIFVLEYCFNFAQSHLRPWSSTMPVTDNSSLLFSSCHI